MLTGYLHPGYAESLSEFGTPLELPRCGGWILVRQIPGFPFYDAMGCYPLFTCQEWSKLILDLENIGNDLVSLSLVTDPFGKYDEPYLHRCFDLVIPFKEHFIVDMRRSLTDITSRHRRHHIRRALKSICVEELRNPPEFIEDWIILYSALIENHKIKGIRAFSRKSFTKQLEIPGLVMFRSLFEGKTIGAQLLFIQGDVGYEHLAAFTKEGYELGASNALYWTALERLSTRIRWLDWGGGAGVISDGTDGLSQYKRGWSTGTRTAFFCGRIMNREKYSEIVDAKGVSTINYFPAYRWGEF